MHRSIFFTFACIDLQFCREAPDPCRIINHGLAQLHMRYSFFFSFACIDLDLNYKVHNCACADLSFFKWTVVKKMDAFKELTPCLQTYELCGQGKE